LIVRVLIVDTCYDAFLQRHYAATPGLAEASYARQWRALMDTFFGTADSYSHYLGELGHVAQEVVVNCEPLQDAWAREHGLGRRWRRRPPPQAIALAQADDFRPDVVYVQNLGVFPAGTLRRLGVGRLLVGQIASELPGREQLAAFDVIFTSFPHYVPRLRELGLRAEYFRIGFDPRVLRLLGSKARSTAVAFVGGLGRLQHRRGNELLERAARRLPIEFWGVGVDDWPPGSPVRTHYRGEAWGLDMFRILAGARIVLNRHIDVAEDNANNMRLYEATGAGALLLTDEKRNLAELFEPGREVVTYGDEDELVERARYFLEHESERAAIARAGHERTLREHTYAARMRELAQLVGRYLP
jgi:spore maturation protein CgeB